ncbi:MAG: 23S rRNA (adenine(2030)-N(6))-methyltransferase RlmJ [Treponema sp.]|jgi:23S rRNA (adenine2030-N6)-methyltransferase|nr:23S rRNA (adenine(2030)-N(6))-methyltransferase RlmJ [Treponema sp.]
MLGYRHAFHAGGGADVLKHTTLVFCLKYLCQKEKASLYIDTHAGAGSYALAGGYAEQNKEWKTGVAKLMEKAGKIKRSETPVMLNDYLSYIKTSAAYPGSPALAQKILRPYDRIVCYEKHPADFLLLNELLSHDCRAEARNADGFEGIKSLLPPPSRRACVLIDPSYEMQDDYEKAASAVMEAIRRFPTGLYLVWYPLLVLDNAGETIRDALMAMYNGNRCFAEIITGDKWHAIGTKRGGLYGSGLVVYNPPWTLKAALEETLPFLVDCIGGEHAGGFQWIDKRGDAQ